VGLAWLGTYAAGRFLLSYLREDSLLLGLRQAQWAGLLMVLIAIGGIAYLLRRRVKPLATEPVEMAA